MANFALSKIQNDCEPASIDTAADTSKFTQMLQRSSLGSEESRRACLVGDDVLLQHCNVDTAGQSTPEKNDGLVRSYAWAAQGPTVLRMALGAKLRLLREARGISRELAGFEIRGSHAKISRLEAGKVAFRERDVADLLTLYGVTDEQERDAFFQLTAQANEPGWWHEYRDILPHWFEMYLGLEQGSSIIWTYEPQIVPGLLQTEDCARMIIRVAHPNITEQEVERRLGLRMARQQLLTLPEAPDFWSVVSEVALWRACGRAPMRIQIKHLLEMAELPNVTIQTIPFRSSEHAAASGPFTILRFAKAELPDIVYLEQLTTALYIDKNQDVDCYFSVMKRLSIEAASPTQTIEFLHRILKES